jgi:multiple sugar transport system substrate-binding protein
MKKTLTLALCLLLTGLAGAFAADKPVELIFWHYYNASAKYIEAQVKIFNDSQTRIKVVPRFVPRDELMKQYTIGIVGGNLPDLGLIDNPEHAAYAAMGLFLDITDRFNRLSDKDQFFPGPVKSPVYNGRLYGLPLRSNCLALYYNADLFKAAGLQPPVTWADLTADAAKLTRAGTYGLAVSMIRNEEGTFQFLPWLLSAGGRFDKVNSPEGIKALTLVTDLVKKGYISSEVLNWNQNDVEKQFASGRAAMMINGPWVIGTVKADAPALHWGVVKLPKDKVYASVLGGENLGIMASTKHPDEAWEFLEFITGDANGTLNKDMGTFPVRKDILAKSSYWSSDPILQLFGEELQYALPRGPHPQWPEISAAISLALNEAATGTKTPKQAFDDAQTKIDKVAKK